MEKRIYRLEGNTERRLAAAACMTMPHGAIVTIQEETRTLAQNAELWPRLSDISRQVLWHGLRLSPEDWKEVFAAALKKQKVVPGLDGSFVVCGGRTSYMRKQEFAELMELAHAFGTEHGVRWTTVEQEAA